MRFLIFVFVTIFSTSAVMEHPFCFRFTWLGAYQDKKNIASLTCEHIRGDLTYIPCRRPLVTTNNDEPPDMFDLWNRTKHDKNLFGCPMTPGQSCVKFSYIYNKAIQNITYMCAKVNATDGCYTQKYITGLEVEVCVCKSIAGDGMPCNKVNSRFQILHIFCFIFSMIFYLLVIT